METSKDEAQAAKMTDEALAFALAYRRSTKQIGAAQKRWLAALEAEAEARNIGGVR